MKNGEFLKFDPLKDKNNDHLIDELIPSGQIVLAAGLPGEGKSFFTLGTGYHLAYGAPFLGKKTCGGSVLIIDSENPRRVLITRIDRIKRALEEDGYKKQGEIDIQHYPNFMLDDKRTWREIEKVIRDIKPVFISIDHLRCFHNQEENNSGAMEKVANALLELFNICGSTVFVSHHFNKRESGSFYQRLRGSGVIYARSEAAFEIRALKNKEGRLESFGIIPQPRKEKLTLPIRVVLEETEEFIKFRSDGNYDPVGDPILDSVSHMAAHIFIDDKKELTVNDVKDVLAGMANDKEIRESLRILGQKGMVETKRSGSSHKFVYAPKSFVCPWCKPGHSPKV
jgi:archaellum biogenesis ATPase FlaH